MPFALYSGAFGKKQKNPQGITIVGDQEMPKMLYIVPWKTANLPDVYISEKIFKDEILYNPCQFVLSGRHKKFGSKSDWSCILKSLPDR